MKTLKTTLLLISCVLFPILFSSCGHDDPVPVNENDFSKFNFVLTLSELGNDQNDIVITTVEYTSQDGRKLIDTFGKANGTSRTIKSEDFTRLGIQGTIKITETLLNGVDYDQETYDLGLRMDLEVTSYGKDGKIISSLSQTCKDGAKVKPQNFSRRYPYTTTFVYYVDEDAKVSITKK